MSTPARQSCCSFTHAQGQYRCININVTFDETPFLCAELAANSLNPNKTVFVWVYHSVGCDAADLPLDSHAESGRYKRDTHSMPERDLTAADSDTAACRLFIDASAVITAQNAAPAAFCLP